MNKKKTLIILCSLLVLLMTGAVLLYNYLPKISAEPETEPEQQIELPARPQPGPVKDFTVYNASGEEIHLSDYRGTPVVLNFWASWCGPCIDEMPRFQQAFEEYGDQIVFMMVNVTGRDSVEAADAVIDRWGYTFPVYYDTENDAGNTYTINCVPATAFIDTEGRVITSYIGTITPDAMAKGIAYILED